MINSKAARLKNLAIKGLVSLAGKITAGRSHSGMSGRFLIVTTTGIGDTLWGTPAIKALRRTYPDGYIAVLTNALGAEMLKGNPAINEVIIFRRGAGGFLGLPLLVGSLMKRRIDQVFIFHASDRIIWPIAFLSGAPQITGFKGQSKDMDFILTKTVGADPAVHGIENRFRMLAEAGVEKKDESLELFLDNKEAEEAGLFMNANNIGEGELVIGLHPGAQKPFKCWPARNFIEAGRMLKDKYGCRIVVTGNACERELAETVASGIEGAISAAGKLSLRGTAALIKRMSLFITNDTGPMHMAFGLKTHTIALFSPTDPGLCGPYGAANSVVIRKPVICVPCKGKQCCNPVCLEKIDPKEVIVAAEELMGESKGQ